MMKATEEEVSRLLEKAALEARIAWIIQNFHLHTKTDEFYVYFGKYRIWKGIEIKLETGDFFFGKQTIITGNDRKKLRKLIDNLEK
jgi:hypothetical protein